MIQELQLADSRTLAIKAIALAEKAKHDADKKKNDPLTSLHEAVRFQRAVTPTRQRVQRVLQAMYGISVYTWTSK